MVELLQPHPLFQEEFSAALNDNFALEFPRAVWPVKAAGSDLCGHIVSSIGFPPGNNHHPRQPCVRPGAHGDSV